MRREKLFLLLKNYLISFATNISLMALMFFLLPAAGCSPDQPVEVNGFSVKPSTNPGLYRTMDGIYGFLTELKSNYPRNLSLFVIGQSQKYKRPIALARVRFNRQKTAHRVLFVAGTHGDEGAPVEAILYVLEHSLQIATGPDSGKYHGISFDVVPVHNPDGYFENERENGAGIDLNRNFPFAYTGMEIQSENEAIINLVNLFQYDVSLFFHSANETKYDNLIRVPVELNNTGPAILGTNRMKALTELAGFFEAAGNNNKPEIPWRMNYTMVNAPGIASDWMVSGFINNNDRLPGLVYAQGDYPNLSLTLEICYPKQPQNKSRLLKEKQELWDLLNSFLRNYSFPGENK